MRSAGVEADEPNQATQPTYAVYSARGTAKRDHRRTRLSGGIISDVWRDLGAAGEGWSLTVDQLVRGETWLYMPWPGGCHKAEECREATLTGQHGQADADREGRRGMGGK